MQINNYTQYAPTALSTARTQPKAGDQAQDAASVKVARTDSFEKSAGAEASQTGVYGIDSGTNTVQPATEYKTDFEKVSAMKADLSKNIGAFKQMVQAMLEKQGFLAGGDLDALVQIDKETQLAAQEAISEDGYWGVNKTSERIVDFAKALSGGDPSKIPLLKQAVLDGFSEAEKAWGGELPEITGKTRDRIMQLFDEWEKGGAATEAEPLDAQA
jgi:hypothetical protein